MESIPSTLVHEYLVRLDVRLSALEAQVQSLMVDPPRPGHGPPAASSSAEVSGEPPRTVPRAR
jgi:hypothetical protein